MNTVEITQQTKAMIDGLKAVCTNFGLGNAASEYKIMKRASGSSWMGCSIM